MNFPWRIQFVIVFLVWAGLCAWAAMYWPKTAMWAPAALFALLAIVVLLIKRPRPKEIQNFQVEGAGEPTFRLVRSQPGAEGEAWQLVLGDSQVTLIRPDGSLATSFARKWAEIAIRTPEPFSRNELRIATEDWSPPEKERWTTLAYPDSYYWFSAPKGLIRQIEAYREQTLRALGALAVGPLLIRARWCILQGIAGLVVGIGFLVGAIVYLTDQRPGVPSGRAMAGALAVSGLLIGGWRLSRESRYTGRPGGSHQRAVRFPMLTEGPPMSLLYRPESVSRLGVALFLAAGASAGDALATVEPLVTSSLMGHDSHGVIRIPEYLGFVADGSIVVDAPLAVQRTGPSTAVVDCGRGFGAVGAAKAIGVGIDIARDERTACVITRRCNHVGRLGAWVQLAADSGMLALATCNSPNRGHYVLPWGGRDGRLGTNPIAYAVPTGGDPVVADFSTSVAPEGKVRWHRNQGKNVPDGWILDALGNATNDPNAFYGPPRGGIRPLGAAAGHKGFALGLLVEILGTALAGISSRDPDVFGNGVCFIVVDPSAFCPLEEFRRLMDQTVAYIKSSRPAPGFEEVLVPGELEFRTRSQRQRDGIPVDAATLAALREHGARLGVDVHGLLNPEGEK